MLDWELTKYADKRIVAVTAKDKHRNLDKPGAPATGSSTRRWRSGLV